MNEDTNKVADFSTLPTPPNGWCWTTLEKLLAKSQNGFGKRQQDDGTPCIVLRLADIDNGQVLLADPRRINATVEDQAKYGLKENDLIAIRVNGSPNLVGRFIRFTDASEPVLFCDHFIQLRFRLPELAPFIRLVGDTPTVRHFIDQNKVSSAGQNTVSQATVERLWIPLAPLNEQRRIVAKIEELFSDLDAGVAALERIKANLKRYRAAVLKAAVEGKLTEEWRAKHPRTEPASKLLERILADRRRRWEEDQLAKFAAADKTPPKGWRERYFEPAGPDPCKLPALPKGWCWVALGQVAHFQNGRAFPSKEYATEGVKLLRPGNLFADGSVGWTDKNSRFMPPEWAEKHPTYIIRGNELVMNLTAQSLADEFLGRTCLTDPDEYCLLNQRLARITPFSGMDQEFALYLLKSSIFRRFVNGLNTGSLIEHMFTSQLENCYLPMSPPEEQREIVQEIERRYSIIEENEAQVDANLTRSAHLRQSILKRAFHGKLVPQDPNDEPAEKLLESIRQERAAANGSVATKARKGRSSGQQEAETHGAAS